MRQKRPRYTVEFKTEAVRLYHAGGKSLAEAARDIGIAKTTLAGWVKPTEIDAGRGPKGALTTEEREELIRLRRENRQVKQERKSQRLLRQGELVEPYELIETEEADFSVTMMCKQLSSTRKQHRLQHEPKGRLLGQLCSGELLRHAEKGTHLPAALGDR